jgi:DNA-directed RNA polymerase II subunit RPB2
MFPQEARARNFTYSAHMFVDVKFTARVYRPPTYLGFDEHVKVFEGVSLGKIPVMLGSSLCIMKDFPLTKEEIGECPYDPFGYFLIHGSERTILSQEKVADNRIMVFFNKKNGAKFSYSAEMKSLHESFTTPPKKLEIRMSAKFNGFGFPLTICVPRFREDIPLIVMFRAFGMECDEDIVNLIWTSDTDEKIIDIANISIIIEEIQSGQFLSFITEIYKILSWLNLTIKEENYDSWLLVYKEWQLAQNFGGPYGPQP